MSTHTQATIDPDRLNALLGQAVVEFGATVNAALVVIGDRLGLYRALADTGPLHPAELAERTGTAERYVREWLGAQAASGFVEYDPGTGCYALTAEQAAAFADEAGPAFVGGAFQVALGAAAAIERIQEAFLTGRGMGWHEHGNDVFEGLPTLLRTGIPGEPAGLVDPRTRRCPRPLAVRGTCGRRGLRPRRLDGDHRPGLPQRRGGRL